jgi:hypothetical protein
MAGFTTIGGSCHWQDKTYINELIGAFNEREPLVSVVGVTAAADTPVVVGDSAQLSIRFSGVHVGIEMMQKWCEDICVVWSDVTGTFDGAAYPGALPRWTLANFRTAAGIPSGFRRVTTGWPADWTDYGDAAYVCGLAAEGDKVGPWLWQDLQQAFGKLVWLDAQAGVKANGANNWAYTDGTPNASAAAAKAAAVALYTASAAQVDDAGGLNAWAILNMAGANYQGHLSRYGGYASWTSPDTLSKEIDFYVGTRAMSGAADYDAQGDGIVVANRWKLWRTDGATGSSGLSGASFGSLATPTWPAPVNRYLGYRGEFRYVMRYDVAGGFQYY